MVITLNFLTFVKLFVNGNSGIIGKNGNIYKVLKKFSFLLPFKNLITIRMHSIYWMEVMHLEKRNHINKSI